MVDLLRSGSSVPNSDYQSWLSGSEQPLIQIATDAGRAIMSVYDRGQTAVDETITHKVDNSPLTEADLAAHHSIVDGLCVFDASIPVVSEEEDESLKHRSPDSMFWLIDPLDGTKEFIARNGEFTVNIALIHDGHPVWGVVHAPALGLTYWGGKGLGAYKSVCAVVGSKEALTPVPIRVSGLKRFTQEAVTDRLSAPPLRVVASKSHLNAETSAFIEKLGQVERVQAGSSLKFCKVAEGSADVYPRLAPTCEWDTAAAQAVLEGAGGHVFQPNGKPLCYGKAEVLNPNFVASAMDYVGLGQLTKHHSE